MAPVARRRTELSEQERAQGETHPPVNVMRDLADPRWMYTKAALLLVILFFCCALMLVEVPTWRTAALLALVIWTSARLYYFLFYVIERYIDPSYRFSGIGSALRYFLTHSAENEHKPPDEGDTSYNAPPNKD